MSHTDPPSEHAKSLLHVAAELQAVSDKTQVEDRRRTLEHWIRRIIMSAEYIDELRKRNHLQEIHMSHVAEVITRLEGEKAALKVQLAAEVAKPKLDDADNTAIANADQDSVPGTVFGDPVVTP